MSLITVNQEKCIACGLCVKVCPEQVLKLGSNGPEELCAEECLACGHCVAVCPKAALDNSKTPLSKQTPVQFPPLSSEAAAGFIRSRRSIRAYKQAPVPREKLTDLVNIAHYAPSGHNLQGISYVIIDDRKLIDQAVQIAVTELEQDNILSHFTQTYRAEGTDTILRGAPCLILATANTKFLRARENTLLSFAYLELYAPTLGLGSCWAGIFERIAGKTASPLLELFKIPNDKQISGAVMVGYPQYKYPRLVDRNPLEYSFLTS